MCQVGRRRRHLESGRRAEGERRFATHREVAAQGVDVLLVAGISDSMARLHATVITLHVHCMPMN